MTSVPPVEGRRSPPSSARLGAASSLSELVRLTTFLVLNVAAFLLIIRVLPKDEMGWYALVNVVVNLAYVVADLQMDKVAVRRLTQGGEPSQVLGAAFGVRLTGSVIAAVATQALFLLIGLARGEVNGDVQLAALLASSQYFGETCFVVGALFQAQLRAYLDVAPRIIYAVARFLLTLVLLAAGVSWWMLFLAWVGGYAIAAVAVVALLHRARVRVRPHVRGTRTLVREALTLGVAGLLGMATVQFGTLYLGVTAPPSSVAVFNAAILPIQYLSLFASVVAIVAFPLLAAAWGRGDHATFARVDAASRTAMLALFLPVSVLLFQTPLSELLEDVFGAGYGAAAAPLRLMSVALILAALVVWAGFVFLAVGKPRLIITVNLVCLTAGIAACPIVVPRYGLPGLGAIGIGATALGAVIAGLLLRRCTPFHVDVRGGVRVLAAGALLWLTLELVGSVTDSFVALLAVTAIVYPLLILASGAFPRSLLGELRHAGPPRSPAPATGPEGPIEPALSGDLALGAEHGGMHGRS